MNYAPTITALLCLLTDALGEVSHTEMVRDNEMINRVVFSVAEKFSRFLDVGEWGHAVSITLNTGGMTICPSAVISWYTPPILFRATGATM